MALMHPASDVPHPSSLSGWRVEISCHFSCHRNSEKEMPFADLGESVYRVRRRHDAGDER